MIEIEEFEELMGEFVSDNFEAYGCKECHELCHSILPQDFKGSYKKELTKLFNKIKKYMEVI